LVASSLFLMPLSLSSGCLSYTTDQTTLTGKYLEYIFSFFLRTVLPLGYSFFSAVLHPWIKAKTYALDVAQRTDLSRWNGDYKKFVTDMRFHRRAGLATIGAVAFWAYHRANVLRHEEARIARRKEAGLSTYPERVPPFPVELPIQSYLPRPAENKPTYHIK